MKSVVTGKGRFFGKSVVCVLFEEPYGYGHDSSRDIMHPRHIIRILVPFWPDNWYLLPFLPLHGWRQSSILGGAMKGEMTNLSSGQMKL